MKVCLSIFLHESDPRRDHQQIALTILSLHALALHLAVKILSIFCMKIWARWPYIHLSVVSRMPAGPHFLLRNQYYYETFLIFDINHQQNTSDSQTKTWNDKNDNANYAPRITWKVLPMAQVAIFKEIFDQVRKISRLWIVLFLNQNVTTSHIIVFTI